MWVGLSTLGRSVHLHFGSVCPLWVSLSTFGRSVHFGSVCSLLVSAPYLGLKDLEVIGINVQPIETMCNLHLSASSNLDKFEVKSHMHAILCCSIYLLYSLRDFEVTCSPYLSDVMSTTFRQVVKVTFRC